MLIPYFILDLNAIAITFSMIGKFAVSASYGLLYIYVNELFPTVIRSMAIGACSSAGRVGGILVPFILELVGIKRYSCYAE